MGVASQPGLISGRKSKPASCRVFGIKVLDSRALKECLSFACDAISIIVLNRQTESPGL
jgi:hypothetical protein